ncbi:plasmid mobilization protein [Puia dinghuensis]|uniref:plasmid mobilization protein n=1 Tax=Puia dinghuensis TaxID=1792502 RepID=UPI00166746CF|nr:plasmid mobilization relaxosome protein MobC [Puia dinghuensis]
MLNHVIAIRIDDTKYNELKTLLDGNEPNAMSRLLRDILYNEPVTVYAKDPSLDIVMEELGRLRAEIKAIGVNINQITRQFNTYPEPQRKALYAKMAFKEHLALQPKITQLLEIISQLAKRWLSE